MNTVPVLAIASVGVIASAGPVDADRSPGYFYDTRYFVDEQIYDGGNGNAYSGIGAFGALHDLMLADDFRTTEDSFFINRVVADYVTFFGGTPSGGLQVDVWTHTADGPGTRIASQTTYVSGASSWTDTIFGLAGRRLEAFVNIPLARSTRYYIMIQPVDLTTGGDWYYQVRDLDSRIGGDAYGKDGGRANGGYGTLTWTSMEDLGYAVGDAGMALWVCPGPGPLAILALAGLGAAGRRREP